MTIGIPREIKPSEYRVSLPPSSVLELVMAGHEVVVEAEAGAGSGFTDLEYLEAGARIASAEACWAAGLVVKVKEPLPSEYRYFRKDMILFTYLHLAAVSGLADEIRKSGMTAVAYEMVQLDDGSLPLLAPMSEVAGRIGAVMAAALLLKHNGGRGLIPGGVPGVGRARFVIVGAGVAGSAAVQYAVGMGADVTVLDVSLPRLRFLEELYESRITTLHSNRRNLARAVAEADAVISTVLIPGARAPHLITEAMVTSMAPGSVIVDIAIDQGGSVETVDRPTTHDEPTYLRHGVLHYAVANMPGTAPRTSTFALSNATFPYVRLLADQGKGAFRTSPALERGRVRFDAPPEAT